MQHTNRQLSFLNGAIVNAITNSGSSDDDAEDNEGDDDSDSDENPLRDAFEELERQGESHVTTGEVLVHMNRAGGVAVTRSNPSGLPSAPLVGTAAGTIGTLFPFLRRGPGLATAVAGGSTVQGASPGQIQLQQVGQTSIFRRHAAHCNKM